MYISIRKKKNIGREAYSRGITLNCLFVYNDIHASVFLARVLIDMSGLVDIAIHCTYQTDEHGLHTSITPVMLVPACATCFSPCAACEKCRRYICGTCNEKHMLFDDLLHPNIYCSYCVDQKDYSSSASSERSDSCSGSLSADGLVYLFLQRLWENMATSRLKDGYWVNNGYWI